MGGMGANAMTMSSRRCHVCLAVAEGVTGGRGDAGECGWFVGGFVCTERFCGVVK